MILQVAEYLCRIGVNPVKVRNGNLLLEDLLPDPGSEVEWNRGLA
jgi:hypothetical protein